MHIPKSIREDGVKTGSAEFVAFDIDSTKLPENINLFPVQSKIFVFERTPDFKQILV
jgi:hypothetical protein